ncbi:Crp/Fnr family transcriptional regulator [Aquimarina hainanensis]|uniref:Crp/Fnr family transcriptional regulator n=1 Tax=Aquimarina hainanensis TaxID=1578017 RepID=A0ABW5NGE5_9FLAO|nr:cyclic nucleotide-binding domain-containing protein [Aquimarina sp. TRL1]QKX07343.1 Crp/Fnr family transcriptional regulator [Aquimarina sp. TRL1]
MDKLAKYIKARIDIDDNVLSTIVSSFESRTIAKGKFAIKKNQLVTDYYFILSGGLRMYIVHNDIELTRYFAFEGEMIADISKIKARGRSNTYIEAIENTELLTIKHEKMELLYETYPIWQKFGRLLWEESFASVLNGVHNFQTLSAKERYLDIMKRSDIVKRVPLKDLSSFLGITPSSLSRIRKEIK